MRKFGFSLQHAGIEQLTRDQLKKVVGGFVEDDGGGGSCCCAHNADWSWNDCGYSSQGGARDAADAHASSTERSWYCCTCNAPIAIPSIPVTGVCESGVIQIPS